MTRGTLRMTGAALALLCMSGCAQSSPSEAESPSAAESPTPTPSPTDTYTPSPEVAAFADAIGAQDDDSLTTSEQVCALEWSLAYMNGDFEPDCYLPGVATDDLGLEPRPTPTATTSTESPETVAYMGLTAAQSDDSLTQSERACAREWAMAYLNDDFAPSCYVPEVETDDLGLETGPTSDDDLTLRQLTYNLLEDAAQDPSLTQEDRECAEFWMKAYEDVHTYQPVCDVPGVHTDGVFDMKPNPWEGKL